MGKTNKKTYFNIINKNKWKFRPTLNKSGQAKYPYDSKEILKINSNIFSQPIILTSDLHSHSFELFERLRDTNIDFTQYIIIMVGDMAGDYIRGSDGNPTKFYDYLLEEFKVKDIIVVQGNHDLPPKDSKLSDKVKIKIQNKILQDGNIIEIKDIGKIGGVNGTISNKVHPYKMKKSKYLNYMKKFVGKQLDVLLTHDTPKFGNCIGNQEIYDMVLKIKPKLYIYGHCHHKNIHTIHNDIHFLNVDGRVLIINN